MEPAPNVISPFNRDLPSLLGALVFYRQQAEILNCETDNLSFGDAVMVVQDVRSSTVGVGDMGAGSARSVVWLESSGAGV